MIPTLPLEPRNRLARLVLAALSDDDARHELAALATADVAPAWLGNHPEHHERLRARARAAFDALSRCPTMRVLSLDDGLVAAAALFDAGLGFEVHEVLEPFWAEAVGDARQALQGLIQIAVGYQHLANANLAGARSLISDGAARLRRSSLEELDLIAFADAVDATGVAPPFPKRRP